MQVNGVALNKGVYLEENEKGTRQIMLIEKVKTAQVLKSKPTSSSFTAIFVLFVLFIWECSSSAPSVIWADEKPKHHTENGFRNYPVIPDPPSVGVAFYLRRTWGSFVLPDVPPDHYFSENKAIEQYEQLKGKNSITWLGHATFLLRLGGKTILTDPFLTEYASPFWIFGPRRYVQPGISLKNLPLIDILIVSHNHLDHLDEETVESLEGKETMRVFVPLGLKPFFQDRGFVFIEELDWNESVKYDGLKLTCLPAVHYSGRSTGDKNKTLWCSWAIEASTGKYFFAGDTAASPTIFKKIGDNHGPFQLAMIPIGAYQTRENWPPTHLTPEQAIELKKDVKANIAVAMHWGTIELSDEPHFEPAKRFDKSAREHGIISDEAWIMKIGETRLLPVTHDIRGKSLLDS